MPTLMVSVSGIRGIVGDGLDPQTLIKYVSAYADFCNGGKIIVGRDARISGDMVYHIVVGSLLAKGVDVIDIGICPTPTVLFAVNKHKANGGIEISASHNPNEWNALKLVNDRGEFMTPEEHKEYIEIVNKRDDSFNRWDQLGKLSTDDDALQDHINRVLNMKYINKEAIRKRRFKVLLDCVNGAGVYVMPQLLKEFGCEVIELNCEKNGIFPRLPEPLPENLVNTMQMVKENNVDLGIVVDPDVDRLVLITEKGEPFGEENTIAQAVRFILSKEKGNVVVNLSTTRSVDDIAEQFDSKVFRSPVGEANVVKMMKEVDAVIGGEGSGGVIFPAV
ncbi:MAG: phosphoglucosamine mutase, partial [Melioribacteraceae bacterium]|nr:phosphoglucosamine mutase [Melioribacteraceae bacterium]